MCGPASLSGALLCFIWLSNIKPVYTSVPVSTYSSLDGSLSLHLQPGVFQSVGEVERREGRIQGGDLFPFLWKKPLQHLFLGLWWFAELSLIQHPETPKSQWPQ